MLGGLAGLTLVLAIGLAVRAEQLWLRCAGGGLAAGARADAVLHVLARRASRPRRVALIVVLALDPGRTRLATEGLLLATIPAPRSTPPRAATGSRGGVSASPTAISDGRQIALLVLALMGSR